MDPQQLLARLRSLTSAFTPAQLATIAVTFVLVVGIVVGSAYLLNKPSYVLLFSEMEPETASDIVTRLKDLNVPYELDAGGRAVRVPAERVDELRRIGNAANLREPEELGIGRDDLLDRDADVVPRTDPFCMGDRRRHADAERGENDLITGAAREH